MITGAKLAAGAVAVALIFGAGWRVHAWKVDSAGMRVLTAEEQRRLEAWDTLANKNTELVKFSDLARASLEEVRAQKPKTLVKTVIKKVEVPSGAASMDCPEPSLGDDFYSLYNDASAAYNALPRAE